MYPIPEVPMDEQTLPERLRYLSTRFTLSAHADDVRVALTGAADEIERLTRGERNGLAVELAGDAGVPSPMPTPRRFAARYEHGKADGGYFRGEPPAPGSFVMLGPVGSVWRVLAVVPPPTTLEAAPAMHVLELEAVDPHDVPVQARVETVPMPVEEIDADADGKAIA